MDEATAQAECRIIPSQAGIQELRRIVCTDFAEHADFPSGGDRTDDVRQLRQAAVYHTII